MKNGIDVQVGSQNWGQKVRDFTDSFDPLYWTGFTPWKESDISNCETQIARTLPDDFKLFALEFGSGSFRDCYGGDIYSAAEIALATPGPMWMILGSADWASEEDHRWLYASRGEFNPLSCHIDREGFMYEDISLFDLLQIGTDGTCNYHQISVSDADTKVPFGYCLLTPDPTFEHRLPSFSAGLSLILSYHEARIRRPVEVVDFRNYDGAGFDLR